MEDKPSTATGFTASLGSLKDIPIYNVFYAYDTTDGKTILLEYSNPIHLGDQMEDSLGNPIQSEDNGIILDTRPTIYYNDTDNCQTILSTVVTSNPIPYDCVLPYV